MKISLNMALLVSLIAVAAGTWMLRRDYMTRNEEFLPGMVASVPYNAQAENVNFRDRSTLRAPEKGTRARDFFPIQYTASPEDARRAGVELVNPIPDSVAEGDAKGATVFATFCQPCHGSGGAGDGTVVQRGFPPPPSLLAEKAKALRDGQIFHIITYGQNNMPTMASQVTRDERWRVIHYVRSLQGNTNLSTRP